MSVFTELLKIFARTDFSARVIGGGIGGITEVEPSSEVDWIVERRGNEADRRNSNEWEGLGTAISLTS